MSLYTQGHYVQTWCHNYLTCPLWPSRPWLQDVVPSIRCLQRVFLHAKPKAACEPHCLSLAATSSSLSLCANMMSSIKLEIRNVSLRRQRRTEPRPQVTGAKKIGEDRTCSSEDMVTDRQTHTPKDRQTHSSQYSAVCSPIGGGVTTAGTAAAIPTVNYCCYCVCCYLHTESLTSLSWMSLPRRVPTVMWFWLRLNLSALGAKTTFHSALPPYVSTVCTMHLWSIHQLS